MKGMKGIGAMVSLAGLLVAGCAATQQGGAPVAAPPALPSEVVVKPVLPAYVCPNGRLIEVQEDPTTGIMQLQDGSAELTAFRAVAGGSKQFVSGEVTVEYDAATLRFTGGRQGGLTCLRRPAAPAEGRLWGTLDKRDRMALPPGTRARVMLLDVSRADAASEELARTDIVTVGNQVPLHWLIAFDPARRQPRYTYALRAVIEDADGRLLYSTDTFNPVPAEGPIEAPIALTLVPVSR